MQIEKNDVNISKLFNWGKKVAVKDKYGNLITELYLRLVGDAELNRARVLAIRASKDLREKLKTQGTDERTVFVPDFEDLEKEEVINIILGLRIVEFSQEGQKEIDIPLPVEPRSDADLPVQEEYQTKVDAYSTTYQTKLNKFILDRVEQEKVKLEKEDISYLVKQAEKFIINSQCQQEMIKKFTEYCAYFGSYSDENFKIPYFENFGEFDNLPLEIKEQFISEYNLIDLNMEELKKSLEVTQ